MEMPYDETLAMLTGTDKDGKQKIPNLQAVSDWIRAKIVNNLLTTEEGFFLDARIGQVLDKRITANATAISQINSDLRIQRLVFTVNFEQSAFDSSLFVAYYTFDSDMMVLSVSAYANDFYINPVSFGRISGLTKYVFMTRVAGGTCNLDILCILYSSTIQVE